MSYHTGTWYQRCRRDTWYSRYPWYRRTFEHIQSKHTNPKASAPHPMNQHRNTVAGQLPPGDPHEKTRPSSWNKHLQVLVEPSAGQCCWTRARTTIERGCSRVSAGPVRCRPRRWRWWKSLVSHITGFIFSPSTEVVLDGRVHLAARLRLREQVTSSSYFRKNLTKTPPEPIELLDENLKMPHTLRSRLRVALVSHHRCVLVALLN